MALPTTEIRLGGPVHGTVTKLHTKLPGVVGQGFLGWWDLGGLGMGVEGPRGRR